MGRAILGKQVLQLATKTKRLKSVTKKYKNCFLNASGWSSSFSLHISHDSFGRFKSLFSLLAPKCPDALVYIGERGMALTFSKSLCAISSQSLEQHAYKSETFKKFKIIGGKFHRPITRQNATTWASWQFWLEDVPPLHQVPRQLVVNTFGIIRIV